MLSLGDASQACSSFANAEWSCAGINSGNVWVGALFLDRGEAVQSTRVTCTKAPADGSTAMFVFQNRWEAWMCNESTWNSLYLSNLNPHLNMSWLLTGLEILANLVLTFPSLWCVYWRWFFSKRFSPESFPIYCCLEAGGSEAFSWFWSSPRTFLHIVCIVWWYYGM